MLPIVNIGPLAIQTPGLIVLMGVWIGLSISEKFAPKRKVDPNLVYNLSLLMIAFGLLGARLGYVALHFKAFSQDWFSLFSLNPGLLDAWSGFAASLIGGYIYTNRKGIQLLNLLDIFTPFLASTAIAAGFANLASGNAYGAPTQVPWAIELWGAQRHPTQVYEILAAVFIFTFCRPGSKLSLQPISGLYFLTFIATSAFTRLALETFRADSVFLPGGFRLVQVLSWIILAVSLGAIGYLRPKPPTMPTTPVQ